MTPNTATTTNPTYARLIERVLDDSRLATCGAVLQWDQETKMPPKGVEPRGAQLAVLARVAHERMTSSEVGDMIAACEASPDIVGDCDLR